MRRILKMTDGGPDPVADFHLRRGGRWRGERNIGRVGYLFKQIKGHINGRQCINSPTLLLMFIHSFLFYMLQGEAAGVYEVIITVDQLEAG